MQCMYAGVTISNQVVMMNLKLVTKTYVMGGPFDFKGGEPMGWVILKKKFLTSIFIPKNHAADHGRKETHALSMIQKSMTHEKKKHHKIPIA